MTAGGLEAVQRGKLREGKGKEGEKDWKTKTERKIERKKERKEGSKEETMKQRKKTAKNERYRRRI